VLRLNAYRLYLWVQGSYSLFSSMIFTVLTVYYVQEAGLNPLQLVLVGTCLELTVFLFEVPTGVLADTYSRRLSVILGCVLVGLCYLIQGFAPFFALILLAEFIRGVGETFQSGAFDAWLADEIGEEATGRAYLRGNQVGRIGSFAGIGLGMALGSWQLNLPVYLGGLLILGTGIFLAFTMPERGFQPAPRDERAGGTALLATFRSGLTLARGQRVILLLLTVAVVVGAFSEGFDRLGEAHLLTGFQLPAWGSLQPVVWLGLIHAVGSLLSLLASEVVIRRLNLGRAETLRRLLLGLTAGLCLSVIGFGLAPSFALAVGLYWAAGVFRSLQYPLATTWLNRYLNPQVRATVLSMLGQADALGQTAGGPVVGLVGLRSLRAALVFAGLILTPALVLYGRAGEGTSEPAAEVAATPLADL
jgi:DHA3 family tetracycline resistance protein-like MFS transporter